MNIKSSLLFAIIFASTWFNLCSQEKLENKSKLLFSDKAIRSFGFQYNNAFHEKGRFEYRGAPDYYLGGHPCFSYGREYIFKYNLTFPSGWGITTEFVAGNRDFMSWRIDGETGKKIYSHLLWAHPLQPVLDYTYYGGQIKASYMYKLNKKVTFQPEIGIKLLKYVEGIAWHSVQATVEPDEWGFTDMWTWREISDLPYRFVPELTAGANFLFHSKKDPRHNFILGINGTLGFIDRYEGWQRFTPTDNIDVSMRWGSSFLAINMGYEFTGFAKPYFKTKEYKKEINANMSFDFSKPVHYFGIYLTSGFSFKDKMKEAQGKFSPTMKSSFFPELNLRYSLTIKDGFGFAVEIPVGLFLRTIKHDIGTLIPVDSVWADGRAVGSGFPDIIDVTFKYVGATLKINYITQIHKNVFIQPEAGIKFMPFAVRLESWGGLEEGNPNIYYIALKDGYPPERTDISWLKEYESISLKHYVVPDITCAVNFLVHGKNPRHNFIFGINANIGLMDRLSFEYQTTENFPSHLQSSGKFGLKSSYLGFHMGYQFMLAKKKLIN